MRELRSPSIIHSIKTKFHRKKCNPSIEGKSIKYAQQ